MKRAGIICLRLGFILGSTICLLELVFQLAFLHLPQAVIQRMPQYRERAGYRLDTEHGARELPAHESVAFEINQYSGDLFRLTCLSPAHAQYFEPYTVNFRRDQHGFRNPEPWHDDLDLVLLGDSFTAAEAVRKPFWTGLADAMLVLAFPGSGSIEQSLLLEAFALPRHPDTVVLAYFAGNDMADNQAFQAMTSAGKTMAELVHRDRSPFEYLATLHMALYLRDTLQNARDSDCHYPQVAATTPAMPVAFFDKLLPILTLDAADLRASEMFQTTQAAIVKLSQSLQARGIRFVMMYIPQKAELFWTYLDAESKSAIAANVTKRVAPLAPELLEQNISAQRELWRSVAQAQQFEFLDLTPALTMALEAGNSPYFFADTHWNQLGHDLARMELQKILD